MGALKKAEVDENAQLTHTKEQSVPTNNASTLLVKGSLYKLFSNNSSIFAYMLVYLSITL